jgi:hypothetical protein
MKNKVYFDDESDSIEYLNPLFNHVESGNESDGMFVTFPSETIGNFFYGYIDKVAGTKEVGIIPAYSLLTGCIAITTTAFNGNITINIGDAGDTDGILPDASITKTLNAVSGEDPATYGVYLWNVGAQTKTAGDYSVTAWPALTTGGDWTVAPLDSQPQTQTKTPAALSGAGTQTKTATNWAVTTYGHAKQKLYTADTLINATVAQTTTTVGMLVVYILYTPLASPQLGLVKEVQEIEEVPHKRSHHKKGRRSEL